MSTEENLFLFNVFQSENVPIDFVVSSNERVIRILHFKMTGTCRGRNKTEYTDICTLADHQIIVEVPDFVLLSQRYKYAGYLIGVLTTMKVPIAEQRPIIHKIFTEVERADNPQCAIACMIKDVTVFCQSVEIAYRLECFEGVRIDSLEDAERQKQCVICRESLDQVKDIEEGIDCSQLVRLGLSQLVRLPCSHLYHGDCLLKWLPMSPLCPLCQYSLPFVEQVMPVVEQAMPDMEQAMPVVEQVIPVVEQAMRVVEQATEQSWPQLHWGLCCSRHPQVVY